MTSTSPVNVAQIMSFVPTLSALLRPLFQSLQRADEPRGLRLLYIDDSLKKDEPTAGPRVALDLLKAIGTELGGYRGTLTLFERADDPRVLGNELIAQAIPNELVYRTGRLPSEQADLGLCIYAGIDHRSLNHFLGDGVREGGFALIQSAYDLSNDLDCVYGSSLETMVGIGLSPSDSSHSTHTRLFRRR